MSTFEIDTEKVNDSVKTLRKLLDECEEIYNKEIPESKIDKGSTHNELYNLCQNVKTTCQYLGELINNSILFLGKSSEMFNTSDRESAAAISIMNVAEKTIPTMVAAKSNTTVIKTAIDNIKSDAEQLDRFFSYIDNNFEKIPEHKRNLLKELLLDKAKYGEVSYTDIYELVRDISTGNIDWGTAANGISMWADAFGKKNSFIQSLTTTMKIMPAYLEKASANDAKVEQYIEEDNLSAAIYTGIVSNGTVIIQGATDGICKIIDKTFHLSTISDGVELFTGIDIGGYMNTAGKGISDAVDYMTNADNWNDISRSYSDFYGGIGKGIGKAVSAAGDACVSAYKGVENFFKKIF